MHIDLLSFSVSLKCASSAEVNSRSGSFHPPGPAYVESALSKAKLCLDIGGRISI